LLIVTKEQEIFLRKVLSAVEGRYDSLDSTSSEENETDKVITEAALTAKEWNAVILDEHYRLFDDLYKA
jgi:hypothetical protein